ncbi:Nedd8-conjugating enzyme ubc-12 [Aphelenchoides besseyi]|nr:Nedd8-conjugating enzyme ubc-12 [Aphelenchoides besseyi]KAI6207906.1 Nedd8-conjugating enzyme ubc-12 [Aphelenchoides besseyi]
MFNIQKRLKGIDENRSYVQTRIAVRDKLLSQEFREVQEAVNSLSSCKLKLPTNQMHQMLLTINPQNGMYRNGTFQFSIDVPPEYNNAPPVVKCLTRVWHPNINEDGAVCLSLLRASSLDGMGWMPTRGIKDVILGLNDLFGDLIDFDDPLNQQASDMYANNKDQFASRVRDYIHRYCK